MSCLMINDIDAGLGRFGEYYYFFYNFNVRVNTTLCLFI